jgi:short subunit dehydrogenase-like uncharacterized protein
MSADRDLDVVVYGATGFVGRLTAEYLVRSAPAGVRIGIAGRSADKLARLKEELGRDDLDVIVADSKDLDALTVMARRTKVVATTVGPYRQYGEALVEACASVGTHYCDLTGEVLFIRDIAERFHETAEKTGARIVTSCGFDSIPSDLGVLLLHEAAGEDLEETTFVVKSMKGGASGGTIASAKGQVDEMKSSREQRRAASDPYALSPDRSAEPDLGNEGDLRGAEHLDDLGVWVGPFIMAGINTRVVRRSNALQGHAYGRRFRYREVMSFGSGVAGRAKALGFAAGMGGLMAGLVLPPSRMVLDRVLPKPGEGPDEDARRNGFFKIEIHGRGASGGKYVARIAAQGDPGYAATAVMLGESALCLARDEEHLPPRAGVLTPATAMGIALVERLRAAGHTFEAGPA